MTITDCKSRKDLWARLTLEVDPWARETAQQAEALTLQAWCLVFNPWNPQKDGKSEATPQICSAILMDIDRIETVCQSS